MADQSHLEILQQGVEAWNSWREGNLTIDPDLSGADLSEASLYAANLSEVNLSGADLSGADLSGANLSKASLSSMDMIGRVVSKVHLSGTNFSEAILSGVRLSEVNLSEEDLSGADLSWADLSGADLSDAHLSGVNLCGVNLSGKDLSGVNFSGANLSRANLSEANLTHSVLVKTNLTGATLTGCGIYGISAWNLNLEGTKQWNLNVSDVNEPAVMVDNLEVAQFIYLLLNHKRLRNVLNAITERGVLILGRFGGGGLEVLEAIAAKLRESKYQPFIFDFDRPEDRNYTETVKTLVGLSRFVIVDLSGPSVPQELYATVPHFKIPFVPVIEEGRRQYSMVVDILEYPWVLNPPIRFVDVEDLIKAMPTQIIAPAEKRVKDRQDRLADLFEA